MIKKCDKDLLNTLVKSIRLLPGNVAYTKDGEIRPGSTFTLWDAKGKYKVYVLWATTGIIYFVNFRDGQVYVDTTGDAFADTRGEAVVTAFHNAVGSAMIAEFQVEFAIGLIAGGAFGRLGIAAVTIADIGDFLLKNGKDFDLYMGAWSLYGEGRRDLDLSSPSMGKLLDNLIYNTFLLEMPGAIADSFKDIVTKPKDIATLIGGTYGALGRDVVASRFKRIPGVVRAVVTSVVESLLGKLKPGADAMKTLAQLNNKSLKMTAAQAQRSAATLESTLNLVSSGTSVYLIGNPYNVSTASLVTEFAANPAGVTNALSKIQRAADMIPGVQ